MSNLSITLANAGEKQRKVYRSLKIYLLLLHNLCIPTILSGTELNLSIYHRIDDKIVTHAREGLHFRPYVLGNMDIPATAVTEASRGQAGPGKENHTSIKNIIKQTNARLPTSKNSNLNKWRCKLEFGFQFQSGWVSVSNYTARAEAEHSSDKNNYRLNGRYLYSESNQVLISNRRDANFRFRHEFSERIFGQALSSYSDDEITGIDLNAEQNIGLGYKILPKGRQTASIGAGVTVQYREAESVEQGIAYLGELFQDYAYQINSRIALLQSLNALYSPDGRSRTNPTNIVTTPFENQAANIKLLINSTLEGKLTERFTLNLRFEYEYDNSILQSNGRTDKRITSSFGYSY